MKKKLVVLFVALFTVVGIKAQEVFNQVVNTNKLILEDPGANALTLSIARFKFTSMQYLCNMGIKVNGGGVDGSFLDNQAFNMNLFIMSYLTELNNATGTDKQKSVMKRYWRASAQHPLFGDKDFQTTHVFANDVNSLTPFSLDTNWELALKAVKENKKK